MNETSRGETNQDLPEQTKVEKPTKEKVQGPQDTQRQKNKPCAEQGEHADKIERADNTADESQESEDQPEAESPEQTLEQALEEVEKFRDLALRAEAEMQNMRKRTQRDVENAHKYGLERFLQNLLPVVDSLEKAIDAADDGSHSDGENPIAEGIRLCHKLLMDVLAKENVEVINPAGEPFDPNEHQAISMIEHQDMEPNSVVAVVQKGYRLNSRLVRPATVMVSKAPEDEPQQAHLAETPDKST